MTDRKEEIRQKVAKAMCAGDGGYPATMADWFQALDDMRFLLARLDFADKHR